MSLALNNKTFDRSIAALFFLYSLFVIGLWQAISLYKNAYSLTGFLDTLLKNWQKAVIDADGNFIFYFLFFFFLSVTCLVFKSKTNQVVEGLQRGQKFYWLIVLGVWIGLLQLSPFPFFGRILLGMLLVALLLIFWTSIKASFINGDYYTRVLLGFLFVIFLIKAIPGAYFPPFHQGIPGWKFEIGDNDPVELSGLKLVRADGESIWYGRAFTSPQNFTMRLLRPYHWSNKTVSETKSLLSFYFALYQKHYPLIERGILPYQRLLGPLAYPGHNPYRMLNYQDFPPESIVAIEYVKEFFQPKTLKALESKTFYRYDLQTAEFTRAE
jgi:hypothetical protein